MRTCKKCVILVGLVCGTLALCQTESSQAGTLILPVTAHSNLSDKTGGSGILIDFGALDALKGKRILYAKCYLTIDADTCVNPLKELEIRPLTREWSAVTSDSVSLTDLASQVSTQAYSSTVDLDGGSNGDTEILLTGLVKAWVDGRLASKGIILLPHFTGCEYRLVTRGAYPAPGWGKIMIRYSEVP
jgi:hypothetical protein